jgi:RNA polymerase sigma-70 factor (ECF subfamily)
MTTTESAGRWPAANSMLQGLRRWRGHDDDATDPWQLLSESRSGKAESACKLFAALAPLAYKVAYRVMANGDDAQDVVQEAFLSLWRSPPSRDRGAQLTTYFTAITLNACRTKLRQRRRLEFWPAEEVVAASELAAADDRSEADAFEPAATTPAAAHAQLDAAMRSLTPRQRLAVGLWAYGDATAADIALALGIEPNAAHQLLFKAKQSLRRQLQQRSR